MAEKKRSKVEYKPAAHIKSYFHRALPRQWPRRKDRRWSTSRPPTSSRTSLARCLVNGREEKIEGGVQAGRPHQVVLPSRVHSVEVGHVENFVRRRPEHEWHRLAKKLVEALHGGSTGLNVRPAQVPVLFSHVHLQRGGGTRRS